MTRIDVEEVKRRNALDRVVERQGVQLRRQGSRLVARCPFHEDRSPSFSVYPETQSFHCFGCGASGDVIDFVRRSEGIGFREALDRLGNGSASEGLRERAPRGVSRQATRRRLSLDDRLTLAAAAEIYHGVLLQTPEAIQYLGRRGVSPATVRRFRLGYSDGRSLVRYLHRRRLGVRRARDLGLLNRDDSEAMTGRLVIPDLSPGRCGWLVGRALDESREPKYRGLALPRPLLGWDLVRARPRVFVTEGPFDWLTLVGWGLPACALLGTQASAGILRLLDRARSVVLVLDNDSPGHEAAARLAGALGERASVLELPDGIKDVSELGTQPDGRATFFRLLDELEGRHRDAAPAS